MERGRYCWSCLFVAFCGAWALLLELPFCSVLWSVGDDSDSVGDDSDSVGGVTKTNAFKPLAIQ
ncbi:hypothetical protein KVJ62_06645 [Helicobacter pylori]|nr:hypothetical protein KVJ62_06645 [Helicobacter pylori]